VRFFCFFEDVLLKILRTRWRGAARLKVAGATACVDFEEIAKTQFKIGYFNKIKSESRQRRVIIGGSAFGRAPPPANDEIK
jgi:hypothetical protein